MEDTDVIYKTQKKQDRKEQGIRTVRIENKWSTSDGTAEHVFNIQQEYSVIPELKYPEKMLNKVQKLQPDVRKEGEKYSWFLREF
jgi:hypothetical protein